MWFAAVLPAAPQNVRVESIGTNSAVLEWEEAFAGTSPVDRYIVQYRIRTPDGLVPYQEVSGYRNTIHLRSVDYRYVLSLALNN